MKSSFKGVVGFSFVGVHFGLYVSRSSVVAGLRKAFQRACEANLTTAIVYSFYTDTRPEEGILHAVVLLMTRIRFLI
jgi:hypothetical protein